MGEQGKSHAPQDIVVGGLETGGAALADRDWLDAAIRAAGGEVTDGGVGCGGVDTGFQVNGIAYSVTLRRRQSSEAA